MSHPDIDPEKVDHLRSVLGLGDGGTDGAPALSPAEPAEPALGGAKARLRARLMPRAKRALKPVLRPALDQARDFVRKNAAQVAHDEMASHRERADKAEAELTVLRAELHSMVPSANALTALGESAALIQEGAKAAEEARATRINSELMKAELGDVHEMLDQLGRAISPDAGLDTAAERLAELRERVDALDRRVRRLAEAGPPPTTAPATGVEEGDGFDYVGFERRFRGEASTVLDTLVERYAERLADHQPVLDVGCGRGELLAALAERGIEGRGVDLDAEMADEAQQRGVDVTVGDAVAYLESLADGSLGSIVCIHVVEHLPLATLTRFLELAAQKVRPGGIVVMETPNPTTLLVLGNSYILDPTHVWPLHPSLLAFLCERAGFRGIDFEFWSPATDYHLPLVEGVDEPWAATVNEAFERLNQVLFGPQEYAIIATAPGS